METEIHIDIYIPHETRHYFQQWTVEAILVHPRMNRQTKCGLPIQRNTAQRNGKAIQTCYTRRLLRTLRLSKISSQKMINVGFHLYGVPQRPSSQRQKMEWWLSGRGTWVARFNGCSFPSERCREYGTGCRGGTHHGAFYATGLYNYKRKTAQFRWDIFYHNENQLLQNIYYLMWVGLHQAAGTVYKQSTSAHALPRPPSWTLSR